MSAADDGPAAKRTCRQELCHLQACVQRMDIADDYIPENIVQRHFKFGRTGNTLGVVTDFATTIKMNPVEIQQFACVCMDIDSTMHVRMISEMSKGRCPDSIVPCILKDVERVLWFASNQKSEIVVFDVTHWMAFPDVQFNEFPCVKHSCASHEKRITAALQNLRTGIEDVSENITNSQFVNIMNDLKALNDVVSTWSDQSPND